MIKMYRFRPQALVLFCSLLFCLSTSVSQASQNLRVSYQYPVRSGKNVLPSTGIGIRVNQPVDVRDISGGAIRIVGSKSGVMSGSIKLADDKRTVIFTPKSEFQLGERVTVEVGGSLPETSFDFTIAAVLPRLSDSKLPEEEADFARAPFLQIPMADTPAPPTFTVHSSNAPAEGYIFLSTNRPSPNTDSYIMVVDNGGTIQWKQYNPTQSPNFTPHKDGRYSYLRQSVTVPTDATFIILDSNFNEIGQIKATDGNATKIHELLLLPNGHMMLLGRYTRIVDMTTVVTGGQPYASVEETVIQEFDASGNIIFQWRTEDHYLITDGTHEDYTLQNINYSFINALSIDNDGQLLASARRMDEITKIDRETGNIIWRLGGKHNQFTLIGDTTWFSHAHNIQALPNGHYIMFDNGLYNKPKVSRGVEYVVDTAAKTVTQVWAFAHPDSIAGDMQGSINRLPNGNTLIGWGTNQARTYTEATPDKQVALDVTMTMNGPSTSYRVYKAVRNLPKASVKKEIASNVLGLSAFPNPTSSSTTLSYTLENTSTVSYSVIDALGRRVQNGDIGTVNKGTNMSSIYLTGLAKGVYTVQVYADGKTSASRIVVE
jgi:hypothetical protein